VPATPPTFPGVVPARPSGWPTTVGVIAIVFGALGSMSYIATGFGMLAMTLATAVPGPGSAAFKAISGYQPLMLANALLGTALALVLLIGGIGLSSRNRWSIPLLRGWAIARLLMVPAGAALGYVISQAQLNAIQQDPTLASSAGAPFGVMSAASSVGIVLSLAWGWALPIFMLAWLSRSRVRASVGFR
jgi:hypothetical protein